MMAHSSPRAVNPLKRCHGRPPNHSGVRLASASFRSSAIGTDNKGRSTWRGTVTKWWESPWLCGRKEAQRVSREGHIAARDQRLYETRWTL